ncbi:MAG: hypothetical protein AB9833_06720 [Bacteroidales bacterium]
MKVRYLVLITIFFCNYLVAQSNQTPLDILSNESIIDMFSKKLPSSIIISKIKSSKNTFNVDSDALLYLVNNKIPEDIIIIMIDVANDPAKRYFKIDPNNPYDFQELGVYYHKKNVSGNQLIKMDPSIYSQNKTKGGALMSLTYGIAKAKTVVALNGQKAQLQITDSLPEFYFYFDTSGAEIKNGSNWWFKLSTSPNEFLLVIFINNLKVREVVTGSANIAGSSIGVDDANKATFKIEKISAGIYKVFFDKALPKGEYCFMYAGSVPTGFAKLDQVYDFGVHY